MACSTTGVGSFLQEAQLNLASSGRGTTAKKRRRQVGSTAIAAVEQSFDHMRADEACAAGDQCVHAVSRFDAHVNHSLNTISVHSARA